MTRRKRLNITTSDLVVIILLGLHTYLSVSKPTTKFDRTQHADMGEANCHPILHSQLINSTFMKLQSQLIY